MSLLNGPGVSNAAAFLVVATDGHSDAQRGTFLREVLVYSADGLREIHGPILAAEAVYAVGDQLVAKGLG